MEHETNAAPVKDARRPRCSIVVPVHNNASLTRQCLYTLLTQPPERCDTEIIVVDDASSDSTPILLAGYAERIRGLTHAVNTGFAQACNDGAAIATGEYLVFLNNDTIPQPGWLDALVDYATRHPDAAIIGSKLLFPNNTIQHAGVVISQRRVPEHIYRGFAADHPAVNISRRFQIVTGACMLVRRDVFTAAGGFDTAFINAYEDVDLCLRVGEMGHEVHYCHESVLYHLESVSRDHRRQEGHHSWQVFAARWRDRLEPDDLQYYLADGLITFAYHRSIVRVHVSPLLGGVDRDEQARQLDLCRVEVDRLVSENIRLKLRVQEAELIAASRTRANGA